MPTARKKFALASFTPPIVISAHGICTAARWQKSLADTLSMYGIRHRAYDFGRYSLFKLVQKHSRWRQIGGFYDFYCDLVGEQGIDIDLADYRRRLSIIAHSFGSYIVGNAMQKYPDIRFDKIILCGSILPVDFDWSTLFHRDQVNLVRNEYGAEDIWASIAGWIISDTGASGTEGFNLLSSVVSQERFEYFRHSDYFHRGHIETHWVPTLEKEPSPLQIRHGRNVEDLETFVRTLNDTAKIDELCFAKLAGYDKSRVPRGLSTTWIEVNPDIYTFLFDRRTDMVAGYINAMPVTQDCFDKIREGTLNDNQVSNQQVVGFLRNQTVNIYLMSVAIDPSLRRANRAGPGKLHRAISGVSA